MGTDINLHFERKNKDGEWEILDIEERLIPNDRNYDLFDFLTDKSKIESGFGHRGIPLDSTFGKVYCHENYVHRTYFYLDEFDKAPWKKAKLNECYFYVFFEYVLLRLIFQYGISTIEEKRNIRICLAFDS